VKRLRHPTLLLHGAARLKLIGKDGARSAPVMGQNRECRSRKCGIDDPAGLSWAAHVFSSSHADYGTFSCQIQAYHMLAW